MRADIDTTPMLDPSRCRMSTRAIADYHRGAVHSRLANLDAAKKAWTELLARPAADGTPRLGRSHAGQVADGARRFQKRDKPCGWLR
jgi:hypothetical protein